MEEKNKIVLFQQDKLISKATNSLRITNKILSISKAPNTLIPYRKGNKWGFCYHDKEIVIDCIYDNVKSYKNKLAAVNIGEKWGFINEIGKIIIPFNYDAAFSFWENYAVVILNNIAFKINDKNEQTRIFYNEKYRLVDPQPYYLFGLFERNDKIQKQKIHINSNAVTVIDFLPLPFFFSQIGIDSILNKEIMEEKITIFNQHNKNISSIYPFYENGKFGYKRNENELIIPAIYDDGYYFEDNLAIVKIDHKWGFINENGTQYWED